MKFTNLLNLFKREKHPDFSFLDVTGGFLSNSNPPKRARDVDTNFKQVQQEKFNEYKLPICPGLNDYSRAGYIITAPVDIHIKANKAGSAVYLGDKGKQTPFLPPLNMSIEIPYGVSSYDPGIPEKVWAVFIDWKVFAYNQTLTGLILAPSFHGKKDMLENLFIYPGIVDYGKGFPTMSFIFSIRKKCEFTIKEGDPILHFIPIFQPSVVNATYRAATESEKVKLKYLRNHHANNFYRKNYKLNKIFKLKKDE